MARTYTPKDAYSLMNALVKQATGQQSVTATDTSSFVSAGELVMATGTENVLNALSILIGRTFMAVRPYGAKLQLINAINTGMYTNRMRKISFYAKDAQPAGFVNTDLYTTWQTVTPTDRTLRPVRTAPNPCGSRIRAYLWKCISADRLSGMIL